MKKLFLLIGILAAINLRAQDTWQTNYKNYSWIVVNKEIDLKHTTAATHDSATFKVQFTALGKPEVYMYDEVGNIVFLIDSADNVFIADTLAHVGDADTYISFGADAFDVFVGNEKFIDITEDDSQDILKLGDGGDIDINLNDDVFIQGSNSRVGFMTTAPDKAVEINSATGINLRLTYNDADGSATYYTDFSTTATGGLGINTVADEVDFNGEYAVALQNIPDLAAGAGKTGLWFDGSDDVVTVSDDANLDFGTGDGAIEILFRFLDISTTAFLYGRFEDGDNNYYVVWDQSSTRLDCRIKAGGFELIRIKGVAGSFAPTVDTWYHIVLTFNNGVENKMYIDGEPVSITEITTGGNLDIAADLTMAKYNIDFANVELGLVRQHTVYLTAAEVRALMGAPVPYKYLGASQTEFMTTEEDRTLAAGTSDWTNAAAGDAYATFDKTGDLSLTADAIGDYCYITFTNIGTVLEHGKRYRLTYDYSETVAGFEFKLEGAATQTLGDAVAGTGQTIEFTAEEPYATTDQLRIVAKTATTAEGDFDNFSIIQIGCVGRWEPDGITTGTWFDKSGNNLSGIWGTTRSR